MNQFDKNRKTGSLDYFLAKNKRCMKNTFAIEALAARNELAEIALQYPVRDHLELRTAIDTLLIMYDEAVILATKMIQIAELRQEIKDLEQQ